MKRSLGAKTLAYVTPVWVVGTYGEDGTPNMMTASWAGICCSKPPCVSVALRAATLSHGNIRRSSAFTVSIPDAGHMRQADFAGVVSGRDQDKFKALGLTAVRSTLVDAPYVQEFPLVIECRLYKELELGRHTLFIGEILDVKAEEVVLNEHGMPSVEKLRPFCYAPGSDLYHVIGECIGEAFSAGRESSGGK